MVEGFSVSREAGLEPVRASNGMLKVRRLYAADKITVEAAHWLTGAQKATLESFYSTNRLLDVTLTLPSDGAAYTVRFAAAPAYEWQAADRWIGRVRLWEV